MNSQEDGQTWDDFEDFDALLREEEEIAAMGEDGNGIEEDYDYEEIMSGNQVAEPEEIAQQYPEQKEEDFYSSAHRPSASSSTITSTSTSFSSSTLHR